MEALQPGGDVVVANIHLPFDDKHLATGTWTIECHGGRVSRVLPFHLDDTRSAESSKSEKLEGRCTIIDGAGGLLLPSFCHSHIHLDKCFILDRCGDLVKGDFEEAMRVTKVAKADFSKQRDDLSVGFTCLEVAQRLKKDYLGLCDVQIAIFAQVPLFDSIDDEQPGENFILLKDAATRHSVSVIGSAPYVEPSHEQAKANIKLVFDIADDQRVDRIDFHLDYNLHANSEPLIYEVISEVKRRYETGKPDSNDNNGSSENFGPNSSFGKRLCPRITVGHATRLQIFSAERWRELAEAIHGLPITFVGLPQSDIYMQGREFLNEPLGAPRGTLRVPYLAKEYGIEVAMSVNNVENAFTPQGSLDPLSLCTFGVAIFQAATPEDIRTLVQSVTLTSKRAIGPPPSTVSPSVQAEGPSDIPADLVPRVGDPADFVILHERKSVRSAVLNPPFDRKTIKGGKLVAERSSMRWSLETHKTVQIFIVAECSKSLLVQPQDNSGADFVILHGRKSVQSVARNPPFDRQTIKDGRLVAERSSTRRIAA
ncbi:hypothetical protein NLJ89_g9165 [Agrocybe chaxingu]|uniref:Uncharacterized protein n=1 Tax=Agrocybe chaxingu TaxID=84603 RepID=A0A9W8JSZ4_9AGAR|nr:hypothetical protein NLJ89_g9165 [Agrocybe chaxingu]